MSSALPGKTVLLGDSGFVGRKLAAALGAAGVPVQGYSSRTLDLRQPEAVRTLQEAVDPETRLIVLAALAPNRGVTVDTFVDNVAIAATVARLVEAQPPRKCVYFSSDAVYGATAEPINEDTPTAPAGLYPLAKHTSERLLQTVAAARNVPLLILRSVPVYGPGDTHNSYGPNRFSRSIARERTVRLFGDGEEQRDHLYVDDLVRMTIALSAGPESGVLNVATGTSHSFGEIVELLRGIAPEPFEVISAPRQGPITHQRFDVARLRAALPPGIQFTPLAEGLRTTFAAAAAEAV